MKKYLSSKTLATSNQRPSRVTAIEKWRTGTWKKEVKTVTSGLKARGENLDM